MFQLAVLIAHGVSSQRTYYVPDNRYQQPRSHYPSHRPSLTDNGQGRDPFDPTYPLGVYPQYAGYSMVQNQRVPVQTLGSQYPAGFQQQAGLTPYNIDRLGWQESAYPSFQGFEDAYPSFNPHMQTMDGKYL